VYSVEIAPSALKNIAEHFAYLQEHANSADYPESWYDSIVQAILGLADFPLSFALAPENDEFEEEIRHRLVGSYRVLFTMKGNVVQVLHVRHGRQDVLRPWTSSP
jgi:plasmid stabilization system protein ParE